jgi:metal-responsive CopG/Arc/MetJ family transcriptional regulator
VAIPGILIRMAKVMISLPDELLASIDADAKRRGMTRSGLIRSYAEEARRRRAEVRAARIEELMADARGHGGDGVEQLKRLRPQP